MLKNTWTKIRNWFKDSETIFLARLTAFSGFIVGALGSIDWTPFFSLDFTNAFSMTQATWVGFGMFIHGIISEIARRNRATDL